MHGGGPRVVPGIKNARRIHKENLGL
jgi:hypothetical protein